MNFIVIIIIFLIIRDDRRKKSREGEKSVNCDEPRRKKLQQFTH